MNSLRDHGAGFATDTNKVTIFNRDGSSAGFPAEIKNAGGRGHTGCRGQS